MPEKTVSMRACLARDRARYVVRRPEPAPMPSIPRPSRSWPWREPRGVAAGRGLQRSPGSSRGRCRARALTLAVAALLHWRPGHQIFGRVAPSIPRRRTFMNRYLWSGAGALALGGAGCVVRAQPTPVVVTPEPEAPPPDYGPTYPTVPPPAPIVEYQPPPPGYGYIWVDGYWDWTGYDWAWTNGSYVPERAGYLYVRPRYVYESNHWVYHRSYWEGPDHRRDYVYGRPAPVNRGAPGRPVYGGPVNGPRPGYTPPPGGGGVRPVAPPQRTEYERPNNGAPGGGFHPAEPARQGGFGQPNGGGFHPAEPPRQTGFGPPANAQPGGGYPPAAPGRQTGFGPPTNTPAARRRVRSASATSKGARANSSCAATSAACACNTSSWVALPASYCVRVSSTVSCANPTERSAVSCAWCLVRTCSLPFSMSSRMLSRRTSCRAMASVTFAICRWRSESRVPPS